MLSFGTGLSHWLRTHPITRMVLAVLISVLATAVVLLAAIIVTLNQRDLEVPAQIRERILSSLNAQVAPVEVSTDRIFITLNEAVQPVLSFQSVKLVDQEGDQFIALDYVVAQASMADLLQGNIKLQRLSIEGVQVPIKRSETGQIGLAIQQNPGNDAKTAGAFDVAETLETVLNIPELSEFERLEIFGITIEYDDALSNKTYVVDGARATLVRTDDQVKVFSDFALISGGSDVASVEMTYSSTLGQRAGEYGVTIAQLPAQDIAAQAPFLSWLAGLDAPISGSIRGGWNDNYAITPTSATLQIGRGRLQPTEGTRAIWFENLKAYLTYDPNSQLITLDEVNVDSRELQLRASGYLQAKITDSIAENFEGHIDIDQLIANPQGRLPEPFQSEEGHVDFRLTLDPFKIEIAQAYLRESKEGAEGHANGVITAQSDGWDIRVNAFSPRVSVSTAMSAWPLDFKSEPRQWINDHIFEGTLVDYEFSMHRVPNSPLVIHYSLGFEDMVMSPFLESAPIRGLRGHLSNHDYVLSLETDAGYIETPTGRVLLSGSRYTIANGRIKPSLAEVMLQVDGTYQDVLWVLNQPPVSLSKRVSANLDLSTGRVVGHVDLSFLLSKTEAAKSLKYSASGQILSAKSKFDVFSTPITADRLNFAIDDLTFTLRGPLRVGGVEGELEFTSDLDPTRNMRPELRANLRVSDRDLIALGVALPDGLMRGTTAAEFALDFPKNAPPTYTITSDMVGISAAIPTLGWQKPTGSNGAFRLEGQLGDTPKIGAITYSGQGLQAEAEIKLSDGKYAGMQISTLRLGDWLNTPIEIAKNGSIKILSGTVHLMEFLERRETGANSGAKVEIMLDRLVLDSKTNISNFRASLNDNGLGPFSGRIKNTEIAGRLYSTPFGPGVELVSTDAAGVLMATGVVKRASGGTLNLLLSPTSRQGELDGTLAIRDIRVQNASVLLEILNAISIVGLLDQLGGPGMSLDEVDVSFRNTSEQVVIETATAFGPSVGITVDGYFFKQLKKLDLQGVISPIYALNAVGALFSGKAQGLIGFNFTIQGETDKPRVVVNPLSAFTPSLFREIFRRPAPNLEK